jgi:hypothetical protein
MTVVGLGHTAQVGKDTAAQILIEQLGFTRISIADQIRLFMEEINPIIGRSGPGPVRVMDALEYEETIGFSRMEAWELIRKKYPEVRTLQQEIGRVVRSTFGVESWTDVLKRRMVTSIDTGRFVMTDVRFPSEVDFIRAFQGPVIKIFRPGVEPLDHETDRALAEYTGWDAVLCNSGSVPDIQNELINSIGYFYAEDDWTEQ